MEEEVAQLRVRDSAPADALMKWEVRVCAKGRVERKLPEQLPQWGSQVRGEISEIKGLLGISSPLDVQVRIFL